MSRQAKVIHAGVVLPMEGPPLFGGAVRLARGRIEAVAPASALTPSPGEERLSLPGCVLLPGLVNAHSHLELGWLAGRVPYAGSFAGWIAELVRHMPPSPEDVVSSVEEGARLLLRGGVTCAGDITATGGSAAPLCRAGIRAVAFREVLGLPPARVAEACATAGAWLEAFPTPAGENTVGEEGNLPRVTPGLSPHAPYSTAAEVFLRAVELARGVGVPLATHLSESLDEVEFVASGSGPFARLLEARGIPLDAWKPAGVSPIRYLADLGVLSCRGALAHVNYLLPGDLELLAAGSMVPVYCPGSHRFFRHPPHPAAAMLHAGIPVALGTDSLASNHHLNLLAEARLAWECVPGTSARDWVMAATTAGARALGLEEVCGTLAPGKAADLVAVEPGEHAADPYAAVLSSGSRVRRVWIEGQEVWRG
ncbi:MAG: amidohydrolase family protein [Armatimonadota bacterium]|nr:amidohydrolase family protein [Armatimonadota bacterium]